MKKIIWFFLFALMSLSSIGQSSLRDSSINLSMIGATFAYQYPGGDMADRFGNNFNVGGVFQVKLKSNFVFGFDGNFLFNEHVRENGILDSLRDSDGHFINAQGQFASIALVERGFKFELKAGKIFPVIGPNKNSGLLATVGAGILQHKIRFETKGGSYPSIEGDYAKGYDRLTNGLSVTEFLGYINFGNKRLVNFYGGLEFTQAFTQSRRDFDFDLQKKDTRKRIDLLFGFRVAWIIPIYKRAPRAYYFD
ncbi:MAG TPA: hypothetical protein PKL85_04425 [Bacteroidia bacterium]|nr:hypothetical protein [Bacteroidia bacterium]